MAQPRFQEIEEQNLSVGGEFFLPCITWLSAHVSQKKSKNSSIKIYIYNDYKQFFRTVSDFLSMFLQGLMYFLFLWFVITFSCVFPLRMHAYRSTCMLSQIAEVRVTLTTNRRQLNLIILCSFSLLYFDWHVKWTHTESNQSALIDLWKYNSNLTNSMVLFYFLVHEVPNGTYNKIWPIGIEMLIALVKHDLE